MSSFKKTYPKREYHVPFVKDKGMLKLLLFFVFAFNGHETVCHIILMDTMKKCGLHDILA